MDNIPIRVGGLFSIVIRNFKVSLSRHQVTPKGLSTTSPFGILTSSIKFALFSGGRDSKSGLLGDVNFVRLNPPDLHMPSTEDARLAASLSEHTDFKRSST